MTKRLNTKFPWQDIPTDVWRDMLPIWLEFERLAKDIWPDFVRGHWGTVDNKSVRMLELLGQLQQVADTRPKISDYDEGWG